VSNRKLLIADDSVTIQKVIKLTFTEEGYEVLTAPDGASAMELLRAERPDIVMADVNMPGPDGYEICRAIRSDIDAHATPVVLLAGSFEPFDEQMASAVGASASVTKPFQSIRQLVHQVNQLVENSSIVENRELPAGLANDDANHSDIESLYQQSIHDPATSVETVEFEFSDQGLDDEMIETQYSGSSVDQTGPLPEQDYGDLAFEPEKQREQELSLPIIEESTTETQPTIEESWTNGDTDIETDEAAYGFEQQADREDETVEFSTSDLASAMDYGSLDRENDGEHLVPVSDGFEFEPVVPQQEELLSDDDENSSASEPPSYSELARTEQFPLATESGWNDVDLLEIPVVRSTSEPVRFTTESEAASIEGKERVIALSDELIERIATRVAEKINRPI